MSMTANPREQRRVLEQASTWVTQTAEGPLAPAEQQAFEAWLAADPAHSAAYETASRAWADLALVQGLEHSPRAYRSPLRAPLFAGFALAAMALVAIFVAPRFAGPQYQTAIAQIAPITLADGSVVTLSARSAIDADFSAATRRQVTLRSGEAFFEVAHNPARPFYVMAGDVAVRVVGTKFDVRRGASETTISVREGVVEVTANNQRHLLHAGDSAIVAHETTLFVSHAATTQVAAVAPANVAAWREGRLDYAGAPLSELVADLNRYYGPGVEIDSGDIADLRVTASFPAGDAEGAIRDLGELFPTVAVERRADGRYILRSQQR